MEIATVAERPELTELGWERTRDTLPEYNNHGDVLNRYWGRLTEEQPDFHFHLLDDGDIVARARSIPVRWDGSVNDLPGENSRWPSSIDKSLAPRKVFCGVQLARPERAAHKAGLSAQPST